MRSPLPGMDPYLEDAGGWNGVHSRPIAIHGELLNRSLGPGFIADSDTRGYVIAPAEQRWIFPGVHVVERPSPVARVQAGGAIAPPVRVSRWPTSSPSAPARDRPARAGRPGKTGQGRGAVHPHP
jgi:hypothetical protein